VSEKVEPKRQSQSLRGGRLPKRSPSNKTAGLKLSRWYVEAARSIKISKQPPEKCDEVIE
jgi:hypothetical protein